jgi:hypothetical protein
MVESMRNYIVAFLIAYGFMVCYNSRAQTAIHMSGPSVSEKLSQASANTPAFSNTPGAGSSDSFIGEMGWINLLKEDVPADRPVIDPQILETDFDGQIVEEPFRKSYFEKRLPLPNSYELGHYKWPW